MQAVYKLNISGILVTFDIVGGDGCDETRVEKLLVSIRIYLLCMER